MNWLSQIFSSGEVISKTTDALISAGDKLVFTDEEKADLNYKLKEHHIKLLGAYEPFKIAQRILAIWFSSIMGILIFLSVGLAVIGADYKIVLTVVNDTGLDYIVLAIIVFYFGGGTIESYRRTNSNK